MQKTSSWQENSIKVELLPYEKPTKLAIRNYILQVFGKNGNKAIKIFTCESGLNPKAINSEDGKITGHFSWGIAQLNRPEFDGWDDYKVNIDEAKKMFDKRGFQPWSCLKLIY